MFKNSGFMEFGGLEVWVFPIIKSKKHWTEIDDNNSQERLNRLVKHMLHKMTQQMQTNRLFV